MGDDTLRLKVEVDAAAGITSLGDFRSALSAASAATLNSGNAAKEATTADAAWSEQLSRTSEHLRLNGAAVGQSTQAHEQGVPKVQQLAGAFSMVGGALSQSNPQVGTAVSVIGQATGTVTALTGVLGPAGLAIGLVTTAFTLYQRAADGAADSTHNAAAALDDYISKARQAAEQAEHLSAVQAGAASSLETGANIQRLEEERGRLRGRLRLDGPGIGARSEGLSGETSDRQQLLDIERQLAQARTANVTALRSEDEERQRISDNRRDDGGFTIGGVTIGGAGGGGRRVNAAQDRANADANAETEAEKRKLAARAARSGGGGTSIAEQEALAAGDLEEKSEQFAQAERAREEADATAREALLTKQAAAEDADRLAQMAFEDEISSKREMNREAEAAQEQRNAEAREAYLTKQVAAEEAAHQRRSQQYQQLAGGIQQFGALTVGITNMIADAQGKSAKGQEEGAKIKAAGMGMGEIFAGIRDDVEAASKFATYDFISGAGLIGSSIGHFANAAQMFAYAGGAGGGAGAGGGGGRGAAAAASTSRPSAFDSQSSSGGGGGSTTTVINLGVFPGTDHAATADYIVNALEAKNRRDGAPIPARLIGS